MIIYLFGSLLFSILNQISEYICVLNTYCFSHDEFLKKNHLLNSFISKTTYRCVISIYFRF